MDFSPIGIKRAALQTPLFLQADTDVTVVILDSNDNAPVFTDAPYTLRALEGTGGVGASLSFTVTDADLSNNSKLSFRFEEEHPELQLTAVVEAARTVVGSAH